MQGKPRVNILEVLKEKIEIYLPKLYAWAITTLSGALIKKIIVTFVVLLAAAINVPAIAILVYSIKSGIPAFEAFDTVKDRIPTLITASVLITAFVSVVSIGPGIFWFNDSALRNLSWSNKETVDFIHRWTIRRWFFVFVPGPVLMFLILCGLQYQAEEENHSGFYGAILGVSAGLVFVMLAYVPAAIVNYWQGARKSDPTKDYTYKIWVPNASILCISMAYSFFYLATLLKFMSRASFAEEFPWLVNKESILFNNFLIYFFTFIVCIILLFFSSVWANRRKYLWMVVFALINFAIIVFILPGAANLLGAYMRLVRLGGNTLVIITADKAISKNWPEMFETDNQSESLARSKVLLLVLSGKEKVFLKLPSSNLLSVVPQNGSTQNGSVINGTLMLDHSVMHDIMYLN